MPFMQPIPPEAADIIITSLREARNEYIHYDAVITIEDARSGDGYGLRVPANTKTEQLVLRFDDVDVDHGKGGTVTETHMKKALKAAQKHAGKKILIHCHAGACRSPGVALAVIAQRMGPGREDDAVSAVLQIRPACAVNLMVLDLADRMLERKGALIAAWGRYEESNPKLGRIRFLKQVALDRSMIRKSSAIIGSQKDS